MKKILIVLFFTLLLGACDRIVVTSEFQCEEDTRKERVEFILSCIENANPMSDEDPEDWIPLCEKIAINSYCTKVKGFFIWGLSPTAFKACSQAVTEEEKAVCN